MTRVLWVAAALAWTFAGCGGAGVPVDTVGVKAFNEHVKKYLDVHRKAAAGLPSLGKAASAAEIAARERELAARIRAARAGARQGDIFTPEVAAEFRQRIAAAMQGPQQTRVRGSLRDAEPVRVALQVNDQYPADVPLQSVPPTLLSALPKLPQELRYDIVGHDLLLHDIGANLIVDFMQGAIP